MQQLNIFGQTKTKQAQAIIERMKKIGAQARRRQVDIEPMDKCLHGRPCRHLDAPGKVSPMCDIAVDGVFYLKRCPLRKWSF